MAVDTNWKTFLSPDSSLPPDVTFLVKGEGGQEKRVAAHRFLLAGTSPVFNRQFFGPMKDTREVVQVKDTTPEAFTTMMNFIYRAPGEESFNLSDIDCPQKLFEALELAERYEIPKLKKIATSALKTFEINQENMIFTATVAKNYKETFADLSFKVLSKCLNYLFKGPSSAGNILSLIMATKSNFPEADFNIFNELISVGSEMVKLSVKEPGWSRLRFFDLGKHHLDGESWKLGDRNLGEVPNLAPEWKVIHQFQTRNYLIGDFPGPLPLGLWVRLDARDNTYYSTSYDLAFPDEGLQLWNAEDMLGEIDRLPRPGEWTRIEMTHEKVEDNYFISVSVEGVEVIRHKVELDPEYGGYPGALFDATVGFGNHEDQLPASIVNLIVLEK